MRHPLNATHSSGLVAWYTDGIINMEEIHISTASAQATLSANEQHLPTNNIRDSKLEN